MGNRYQTGKISNVGDRVGVGCVVCTTLKLNNATTEMLKLDSFHEKAARALSEKQLLLLRCPRATMRSTRQICQLYGFEKLECAAMRNAAFETAKEERDADSIVTEDSVPLRDRINSQLFVTRETETGKVLWKRPMQETDMIAHDIDARTNLQHRLPCHSFRSMLPSLAEGKRPPAKSPDWIRSCTRGILFSAWHAYRNERLASNADDAKFYFPEHVYCWFSDEANSTMTTEDEDRWAFYQGIKGLAISDAEGWIMYQMLNDMQGEHFTSFLFHTLKTIKSQMESSWTDQVGVVFSHAEGLQSMSVLQERFKSLGQSLENDNYLCGINLWISLDSAHDSLRVLFYSDRIKSSATTKALSKRATEMTVDVKGEPCIDVFSLVQIIMKEYIVHMQKQTTLLRIMFETGSTGNLTDVYDTPGEVDINEEIEIDTEYIVSFQQFVKIIKTIWPTLMLKEVALLYREAYDMMYPTSQWNQPAPDGISFASFMSAADKRCLFSRVRANL
eukprot:scaffold1693_cov263-Alexandrium_tamarense.AAC.4